MTAVEKYRVKDADLDTIIATVTAWGATVDRTVPLMGTGCNWLYVRWDESPLSSVSINLNPKE